MTTAHNPTEWPANDVRKQAEQRVPKTPTDVSGMSAEQIEGLLYELEVHQEELKVKNEELRRLQLELESSHERLADLYDFAPVGYVTVDASGLIMNANLAIAAMLGQERSKIVGTRLALYCDEGSRIELRDHLEKVLTSELSQSCELKFTTPDRATLDVRLHSNHVAASGIGDDRNCRVIMTDISRQKMAESRLRESEHRYRRLVESSPYSIHEIELDRTISAVNPSSLKMASVSDESAVLGIDYLSRVSEVDRPRIEKLFDQARNGETTYFEVGSARGKVYESCFIPLTDDTDKVQRVMGIAQDISERRKTDTALRESESFFRTIFEQAAVGVAQLDSLSGRILKVNRRYCEMLDTASEDLVGKTWMELTHPDDLAADLSNMKRLCAGDIREFSLEKRIERRDGSYLWIHLAVSPMWQEGGEPSTHIAIAQDVTERKRAEAERERLLDILQRSLNEIYVFDSETLRFEYVNAGALRNLGYSLDEMYCMTPVDIKPDFTETTFRNLIAPLRSRKQDLLRFETLHQRANGSRYPAEVHLQLIRRENDEVFLAVILDITERKRQEQQFRTIVETTQEWIWEIDLQGVHTYSNPAIETILGYSVDKLIGGNALDLMLEADREVVKDEIPRLVAQKQGWTNWLLRWRHKDGSIRQLESNGTPILDENDQLIGFRGADRDITARKEAEEALCESRERFRQLANNIDEVFWLTDVATHKVLYVSPAYEPIWGRSIEALYADAIEWTNAIHPEDRERVARSLLEYGAFDEWEETYRIVRPDGTERCILDRAFPVRDESGTIVRLAGISEDITDRKNAEMALRESEEKFRALTERSPAIVLIARLEQILYCNSMLSEVTGYSREELLRTPLRDIVHPDFRESIADRQRRRLRGEDVPRRYDGKIVTRSGEERWLDVSVQLIEFEGAPAALVTCVNVTERKLAEAALRQSEETLREVNASLERRVAERTAELAETNAELTAFAHTVSHDLRSPLRAMEGFAAALAEDYGERLGEKGHEFIQHIVDSAQRMDGLVSDLLAYSRLGRAKLSISPICLNAVVDEALSQLSADIEAGDAKVDVAEQLPTVLGHRSTLVQVITNLLSNGIKFTAEGTRANVQVWAEPRAEGTIRLWFVDNGIGIDTAYHDLIFRVFERLHGIESYPGTGIGLAVVARACERLGGRCGLESQLGQGSRFWVEFPHGETNR